MPARLVQPTSGAIRAVNRARLVGVLRRTGPATRLELVTRTGLSRATVSSLVGELRAQGVVSEQRVAIDAHGRPPTLVTLNRRAGLAIAVDIGVRHVAVAVGDLSRRVLAERWVDLPVGHDVETGTDMVLRCIGETLAEVGAEDELLVGAAVSIAAPVSPDSGRLLVPGVLPGWSGVGLTDRISERWQVPVVVENDANLGALAETIWGESAGVGSLLYVKAASRVGLGAVIDGVIYHGQDGYAGEFGHLPVNHDGLPCWCGRRGCLELYSGGEGMLRQLAARRVDVADTASLVQRLRLGDAAVEQVVDDGACMLARGIVTLALILNPAAVVVGGELSAVGDRLLEPARKELALIRFGSPPSLRFSALGDRASLIGALALVLTDSAQFTDHASSGEPEGGGRPDQP